MPGKNSILSGGGFHHVAIRARDFDKSVHFYTHALGFTVKVAWGQQPNRAVMLDAGAGDYLEIFERPTPAAKDAPADTDGVILHFALRTGDTDAAIARAQAAGAVVTVPPKHVDIPITNVPGPLPVRLAFCKGPDGELIEFFQNTHT